MSMLVSSVSGIAESLFATLFPSDCRFCRSPLINISRLPVCQACLSEIHPVEGTVCSVCGERLQTPFADRNGPEEVRCGLCRKMAPPFVKAVAYGSYDGGLRELIHLLKYEAGASGCRGSRRDVEGRQRTGWIRSGSMRQWLSLCRCMRASYASAASINLY